MSALRLRTLTTPLRKTPTELLRHGLSQQTRHARVLPLTIRFLQTRAAAESRIAAKYQDKLRQKLEAEGVESLDQLKERYKDRIDAVRREATVPEVDALLQKTNAASSSAPPTSAAAEAGLAQPPPPAPTPHPSIVQEGAKQKESPIAQTIRSMGKAPPGVKTLASFVDPDRLAAHQDAKEIELIWRARFVDDPHSLCAVVPAGVYRRMEEAGRRYPMFILPLPREDQGVEMHFLQWTFPSAHSSTVIFTSLADYKLRGEFAAPHTTLTHHLELAEPRGVVLAQGMVVRDRGVTTDQAQLLVMALQKFYAAEEEAEEGRRRRGLLEMFSKGDGGFSVESLIREVETIN